MFDSLSQPCISHMDGAILCLNNGWIGILAGLGFERLEHLPVVSVGADRKIQRASALRRVVINHNDATVFQSDRVYSAVWIRQIR